MSVGLRLTDKNRGCHIAVVTFRAYEFEVDAFRETLITAHFSCIIAQNWSESSFHFLVLNVPRLLTDILTSTDRAAVKIAGIP